MFPNPHKNVRGFTLIELMVVVAIVALLAAVALPSYQEQIRKNRRAQAKADVVEYLQTAERYFTANNTYVGYVLPAAISPRNGPAYYTLAINNQTQTTLTIAATAQATGGQDKDKCGDLSVNQAGTKTKSGTLPLNECW